MAGEDVVPSTISATIHLAELRGQMALEEATAPGAHLPNIASTVRSHIDGTNSADFEQALGYAIVRITRGQPKRL